MEVYLNVDIGDPARYNAESCDAKWVDSVCAKCADHGVKKLFWRTSLGRAYYQSKVVPAIGRDCGERWGRVVDVLERMNPLAEAVERAHRHGIELWAWWPFSETYAARGDLNFIDPFYAKRMDLFGCNRDGSRFFLGHPCLAEPEVHERCRLMAEELNDYGVDGILMSTRSHNTVPGETRRGLVPYEEDEFGYNLPVVEEFSRRYGVDITREQFDHEAWNRLKGEYLSKLWQTVREVLEPSDKKLWVDVSPERCRFISNIAEKGRDSVRMYKDWEGWTANDTVDGIVAVTTRNDSAEASIVDMSAMRSQIPADKLYCWVMCMANRPVAERKGHLRLENMLIRTAEVYERILDMAKEAGARGVIGHEMYTVLFTDWSGQEINPVPDDPKAYWSVIKKMHDRG